MENIVYKKIGRIIILEMPVDFLNWHKDWRVTLLHIEPHYANEIRRNIEEATTFQFKNRD